MNPQEQRDLFPGALEMMILQTLKRKPLHGYALAQHIKQTSDELLEIEEGSLYPALQRMLKAAGQQAPDSPPILEVNPEHALVKALSAERGDFADWCHLLFDQALLAEGGALEDPASFVKRTNALLLAR